MRKENNKTTKKVTIELARDMYAMIIINLIYELMKHNNNSVDSLMMLFREANDVEKYFKQYNKALKRYKEQVSNINNNYPIEEMKDCSQWEKEHNVLEKIYINIMLNNASKVVYEYHRNTYYQELSEKYEEQGKLDEELDRLVEEDKPALLEYINKVEEIMEQVEKTLSMELDWYINEDGDFVIYLVEII